MTNGAVVMLAAFLAILGSALSADLEFCQDGHQISKKYDECWKDSQFANKVTQAVQPVQEEYTAKFVEDYATYMCSVVKPQAIECLRKALAECSNLEKLIAMADESGGTCVHNDLNSFFKLHIIDHLNPVRGDSPCLQIGRDSTCSSKAIKNFNKKKVSITRFHHEADALFARIWKCQVDLFKGKSNICKDWQLPMLISLQQMAMPTLFGMKLTQDHVADLELDKITPPPKPTAAALNELPETNSFYILVKILAQKPDLVESDIVLQVNVGDGRDGGKNSINVVDKKKKPTRPAKSKKAGKKDENNEELIVD